MNKIVISTAITASIGIGLGTLWTNSASAFEIFTDREAWLETLESKTIMTETFENFIPNAPIITFDGGIISEGVKGGATNMVRFNSDYFGRVDTDEDGLGGFYFNEITWTFPEQVWAFGGDFINGAQEEILQVFGNYDGKGETFVDLVDVLGFRGNGFIGIIGEAEFNSITYRSRTDLQPEESEGFLVDNFSTAKGDNNGKKVTEPTTILGLLAIGLLGLFKLKCNNKFGYKTKAKQD